jgi:hypothetical protein
MCEREFRGGLTFLATTAEWFNPGAFAAPARYTFGNSGVWTEIRES